jgi:hypothetical protein
MSTTKHEVRQDPRALTEDESLSKSEYVMEKICEPSNLNRAYKAWFDEQGLINLTKQMT